MKNFIYQLGVCDKVIDTVCSKIDSGTNSDMIHFKELYEELNNLLPLMPEEYRIYKDRLENILLPNLKLKDIVQTNQYGYKSIITRSGINPYVFGQIIATRSYIRATLEKSEQNIFWQNIHKDVLSSAKELFDNGHYPEAVENSVLEFTVRIKSIVRRLAKEDLDGAPAMQKAFSPNDPIIKVADIETKTGKDMQQGIMELATGIVRSMRNPRVHDKLCCNKKEAIQKLHLVSFIMDTIDKAVIKE